MKANLTWPDLLHCYDNMEFTGDLQGTLTVKSTEILRTILLVDEDDGAANDSNLCVKEELHRPAIGDQIIVHVGSPKLSLGTLAKDLDALLSAPKGFIEFPKRFYVIDDRLSERDLSPKPLMAYRAAVSLVGLFAEAAAFMDQLEQKLFYFKDGKIELPVSYSAATLRSLNTDAIDRLLNQFNADALHRVQKLTILADAIAALVKSQSEANRFEYNLTDADSSSSRTIQTSSPSCATLSGSMSIRRPMPSCCRSTRPTPTRSHSRGPPTLTKSSPPSREGTKC